MDDETRDSGRRPPRDNLFRATFDRPFELRDGDSDGPPTLAGHFAVFNEWTEIDSVFEGRFMERLAPGAFKKTMQERAPKVLFQHGRDPSIGSKVLGKPSVLEEDDRGVYYEVPMYDTEYNRELLPGLRDGEYGASFRFRVVKEDLDQRPERSDANPEGLPERTIREVELNEFGPVTFPAYQSATAGVRSLTDEFAVDRLLGADPARLRELVQSHEGAAEPARGHSEPWYADYQSAKTDALADGAAERHSEEETSREAPPKTSERKGDMALADLIEREAEIKARMVELDSSAVGRLGEDDQAEWDRLEDELGNIRMDIAAAERRRRMLAAADIGNTRTTEAGDDRNGGRWNLPEPTGLPRNIYAVEEYRSGANSMEQLADMYREGAKRALEDAVFAHQAADDTDTKPHINRLLTQRDERGEFARRLLVTGSPLYHRAFGKHIVGRALTTQEQSALEAGDERALSLTAASGGYAVPFQLDPSIILTSNGVVNPLRQISRVETITTNEWRGVSSAGITASYAAEGTEASDNAPTLGQPVCFPERAQAFVPFSREIGDDWGSLESEMARLLQDAKDVLESVKFTTGVGHTSTEPQGFLVGGTAIVTTVGTAALGVADIYALEEALPPRFRPNATYVGNRAVFNKVRQLDTAGGANLWVQLQAGAPANLIGYPARENSAMVSVLTTGGSILTIGDFNNFLILDRVGMSIEVIPHLFATANNRPSGQRGLYAYWRNSSQVLAWQAFRTAKTL